MLEKEARINQEYADSRHSSIRERNEGTPDKRELTASERAEALATIPTLPTGWMQEAHDWDACDNYGRTA